MSPEKKRHLEFAIKVLRFLRRFCPPHLLEEIEGDLLQKLERDIKNFGEKKARRRFVWNIIRFFRPGIILRNKFSLELNHLYMIKNYIVLASRNMVKNKVFSVVNVFGLSVAITVCLLILHFVRFELSYDDFHQSAENIYRVTTRVTLQNEVIGHETETYKGIAKALKEEFPEVQSATTFGRFGPGNTFVHYEDEHGKFLPLDEYKGLDADSSFFTVFSFPLVAGDPSVVLRNNYSAVVSETMAKQYFDGNAVGKSLETYDGIDRRRYTITGVMRDVPDNSHFKFDLLVNSPENETTFWGGQAGFWEWQGQTYILLHDQSVTPTLEKKLNMLALANNELKINKDDYGQVSTFHFQKLRDIHLFSEFTNELEPSGSGVLVYALIILVVIIIVIAWVNYINLSTAISAERTKEIAVRKVIGASRFSLMSQILTESALFNFLSIAMAIALVYFLFPSFADFTGMPPDYNELFDRKVWYSLLIFGIVSTLIAGSYPAYLIASLHPVISLKGKGGAEKNFSLRKVLVVFQFSAAIILMMSTLISYRQLSFMLNKELGINIDQILVIKAHNFDKEVWSDTAGGYVVDSTYVHKTRSFQDDMLRYAGISNSSFISHLPGELPNWGTEFKVEEIDPEKAISLKALGVDYDFLNTFQVDLLAGRNFSPDFHSDQGNEGKRAVLLNETASQSLGFKNPDDAIQKHISTYWGADYEIIGVVKSFHQLSLKENLTPIYFILNPRALAYYAVNFKGADAANTVAQARKVWEHHFPDRPFTYFFLDDYFERQYVNEQKFSNLMSIFSGLAVFIACLGLFGMTSHSIVKRTKEIGIRKVLGATVLNVIGLFTRHFVKLILVASIVAIPIAYFGAIQWLENYAYKIALDWWLFAVPFFLILGIALLTLSLQTLKTALKNPVESLRNE